MKAGRSRNPIRKQTPAMNGGKREACPILKLEDANQQICPLLPVLQELPNGVIVANRDGRLILFNREAKRILGIGAQQVGQRRWSEVYGCYLPDRVTAFPPDDLPLSRALRGEEVSGELIFVRNSFQSQGVWVRASSKPLRNIAGEVGNAVVVFSDITRQREATERIELLSRAVEQTADSVVITDAAGFIQYVNPAFELTTGYRRDEAVGHTPRILKSGQHDAHFYRDLWKEILEGNVFRDTLVNRKKSGELYWAEQTITPIKDAAGNISQFVSVLKDITDVRKQQEHDIQLRLARQAQERFYAPAVSCPGLDIGRAAYPAVEIGGDYIDFLPSSDGCVGIAVGDVSGHGFDSALVMALTRAYVRAYSAQRSDLMDILIGVNQMLIADLEEARYVTLILVRADASRGMLGYASAGHVPGFMLGRSGEVETMLGSTGIPVGLFQEYVGETKLIPFKTGSVVVLLTDGATESSNPGGEQLGLESIIEFVRAHRTEPAQQLADGICRYARTFAGEQPQQDDIAAVILKRQ